MESENIFHLKKKPSVPVPDHVNREKVRKEASRPGSRGLFCRNKGAGPGMGFYVAPHWNFNMKPRNKKERGKDPGRLASSCSGRQI